MNYTNQLMVKDDNNFLHASKLCQ